MESFDGVATVLEACNWVRDEIAGTAKMESQGGSGCEDYDGL